MKETQPFRQRVFLLRVLVGIFCVEAGFLAFAFWKCSVPIPGSPQTLVSKRCPHIATKSQELFGVAVATTLSLLTGTDQK